MMSSFYEIMKALVYGYDHLKEQGLDSIQQNAVSLSTV